MCAACTPRAADKGWAPLCILMCRKSEHGQDQLKPAETRKFLGKTNAAIANANLSLAVYFTLTKLTKMWKLTETKINRAEIMWKQAEKMRNRTEKMWKQVEKMWKQANLMWQRAEIM